MDNEISNAAHSAGCTDYFLWEIYPDHFAKPLMVAVKRYARFLKDSGLAKSQSEALETVARAAGFAHWHAFHTVVQGLSEGVNAEDAEVHHPSHPRSEGGGRKSFKALIRAFVFMVQASPDCPPSPEEQAGLSKAAAQIAQACGSPIEPVQDMIGRMNGSDTWAKLLARRPEQATGPLYGFHVDDFHGSGEFVFSSACYGLIQQQDVLFQGFHRRPPSQQREFEAQLDRVLGARPDFLEGLLAKADWSAIMCGPCVMPSNSPTSLDSRRCSCRSAVAMAVCMSISSMTTRSAGASGLPTSFRCVKRCGRYFRISRFRCRRWRWASWATRTHEPPRASGVKEGRGGGDWSGGAATWNSLSGRCVPACRVDTTSPANPCSSMSIAGRFLGQARTGRGLVRTAPCPPVPPAHTFSSQTR